MIRWSEIAFTKSVAKFKCAALTNVEYALLIAMIFTKPGKHFRHIWDLMGGTQDLLIFDFSFDLSILKK